MPACKDVGNADIAGLLSRYATLLEIDGANVFRVRAYQNAARLIDGLARNVADMLRDGEDLTELEGIGADLGPPAEITPPASESNAATPPIGKP